MNTQSPERGPGFREGPAPPALAYASFEIILRTFEKIIFLVRGYNVRSSVGGVIRYFPMDWRALTFRDCSLTKVSRQFFRWNDRTSPLRFMMFERILSVLKEFVLRITRSIWLGMIGDEYIRDLRVEPYRSQIFILKR